MTTLVIGTDEAGYGPNLGPLVVAATAWRVDAPPDAAERVLAAAVADVPAGPAGGALWDDSKRVHRDTGPGAVEPGALVGVMLTAEECPRTWMQLSRALGGVDPPATPLPDADQRAALALPRAADAGLLADTAAHTRRALAGHGVCLAAIRCRAIHPGEFNDRLAGGDNKADLLSAATLDLAAALGPRPADPQPALVWCDRHGGRKRYAGVVARHFESPLVRIVTETARHSAYELGDRNCRLEFSVGGECRLPVALASMVAKYVRELSMLAFNAAWCGRLAGLEPTAGYPLDARRWRRDAEAAGLGGQIDWNTVWRRA